MSQRRGQETFAERTAERRGRETLADELSLVAIKPLVANPSPLVDRS